MGIRYRKRIKIAPGIHMNISKSGASFNFGRKGANFTVGSNGTYSNFGIPGSGLSYRSKLSGSHYSSRTSSSNYSGCCITKLFYLIAIAFLLIVSVVSIDIVIDFHKEGQMLNSFIACLISLTSAIGVYMLIKKLFHKKDSDKYDTTYTSHTEIQNTSNTVRSVNTVANKKTYRLERAETALSLAKDEIKKELLSWYIDNEKGNYRNPIQTISYFANLSDSVKTAYNDLCVAYKNITGEVWFTEELEETMEMNGRDIYKFEKRTINHTSGNFMNIPLNDNTPLFSLPTYKLYFYPTFVIEASEDHDFTIKPYKDLQYRFYYISSLSKIPILEAKKIRNYWKHTNSDGTKDMRFKDNPTINLYQFGVIEIDGNIIVFSNIDSIKMFNESYRKLEWIANNSGDKKVNDTNMIVSKSVHTSHPDSIRLKAKLNEIKKMGAYSPLMIDIIDMLSNGTLSKSELLEYLSTNYKDFSDIKKESIGIISQYTKLSSYGGVVREEDQNNISYLRQCLDIKDGETI